MRFGPGNLNAAIFKEGELFSPIEEEKLTTEQNALDELKKIARVFAVN